MQRQQRTNYKRQTLSPSTPPEIADFKWIIESSSGFEIILVVTGPFGGHVFQGIPAFTRSDDPTLPFSAVLSIDDPVAGTAHLTLLYAAPLLPSYTLTIPVADPSLKGRHGGRLRASETVWTDPSPAPENIIPSGFSNDGTSLFITPSPVPAIVNGSDPSTVFNTTTGEQGTYGGWTGTEIIIGFPSNFVNNGDVIELAVEDEHITTPSGGKLQPFNYVAP